MAAFLHSAKVRQGAFWLVLGILGLLGYTAGLLWLIVNNEGGVALIMMFSASAIWRADRVLRP